MNSKIPPMKKLYTDYLNRVEEDRSEEMAYYNGSIDAIKIIMEGANVYKLFNLYIAQVETLLNTEQFEPLWKGWRGSDVVKI